MAFKLRASALAVALGLAIFSTAGLAQTYPNKPVKLVLPYSPGGIVDYIGRTLAQHLGDALGQPVIADNRPGAGGMVGTDVVGRSAPDGYTLLMMDPAIIINPTLQESVPYDFFKQLETVSVVSSSPEVLVVSPALNKSIGASYTDMMANKIQFAFSSIAGALPFTTDNRVIPLATTGLTRSEVYPNQPTVAEAGIKNFTVDLWLAIFTPTGTPAPIKAKLNEALIAALAKPELKAAFAKVGVTPRGTSQGDGAAFVKADYDKWKKVITDGNIKSN